jgi:hypothetical protein
MTGRIDEARTAIIARLEKLRSMPGLHAEEQQAIEDSLRTLRFLQAEEERYQAEEKRLALEKVEKRLRSIAPVIKRHEPG